MLKYSIVIPCYHDEEKLQSLLIQLHSLANKSDQIIVIDGANSIHCHKICTQFNAHWIASSPCRGQQLLTGAALAQGDILWFLHSDTRLSTNVFHAMQKAIEQGAAGGYFRFRFDTHRVWPAVILEPAIAWRCRIGVPYGDQGIFVTREIYHQVGGHAPWPLFEEVPLVRGIRQSAKFSALREPIFVNPRRWQKEGWWRRTWRNRKLAWNFARGVAPQELAEQYKN